MEQQLKTSSDIAARAPAPKGWLVRLGERWGYRLSPVNKRRLERFKAHRLGYRSFLIFATLFFVTLFAELIANDRPLLAYYKGELLTPVLVDYPEEKFGGFLAVTDYRAPDIQDEINANGRALGERRSSLGGRGKQRRGLGVDDLKIGVFCGRGVFRGRKLHHFAFGDCRGGVRHDPEHVHRADVDEHLECEAQQEIADKHARLVAPDHPRGLSAAPNIAIVHDVVV